MALHHSVLATINEENESEISTYTEKTISGCNENNEGDRSILSSVIDESIETLSKHSKTFSIDTNASSYKCFKEVIISTSSIFKNPLYFFPELQDPGIQDAMDAIEPEADQDDKTEMYKAMCKKMEIYPISKVYNSLRKKELNLKYYVPCDKQMKAICKTIADNEFIEELNLQDNWLSVESCEHLANCFYRNSAIKILRMRECRIGPEGMEVLADALASSFVEELDLSFNSLGDEGLGRAVTALKENSNLKKLDLSHNELSDEGAQYLREIVCETYSLEKLNLAWNNLNSPRAMKTLCRGLNVNQTIEWLSLAWNGIYAEESALSLYRYLKRSATLTFLDLSNNLLRDSALIAIMNGIMISGSLVHVKIGNNPFSPQQAYECAEFLSKPRSMPLKILDMENMVVHRRFLNLLQNIRQEGKEVIHGYVLTDYDIHGPCIPKVLFGRCRYLGMKPKKKKNRVDFGHFVLSLPDKPVTKEEFSVLLGAKRLNKLLDDDLRAAIQDQYLIKKNQKINCSQLISDYMVLYPDTQPEPPKKKKRAKGGKKKKGDKNKDKKDEEDDKIKKKIKHEEQPPPPVEPPPRTVESLATPLKTDEPPTKGTSISTEPVLQTIEEAPSITGSSVPLSNSRTSVKSDNRRTPSGEDQSENKKNRRVSYAEVVNEENRRNEEMPPSQQLKSEQTLAASGVFILENE